MARPCHRIRRHLPINRKIINSSDLCLNCIVIFLLYVKTDRSGDSEIDQQNTGVDWQFEILEKEWWLLCLNCTNVNDQTFSFASIDVVEWKMHNWYCIDTQLNKNRTTGSMKNKDRNSFDCWTNQQTSREMIERRSIKNSWLKRVERVELRQKIDLIRIDSVDFVENENSFRTLVRLNIWCRRERERERDVASLKVEEDRRFVSRWPPREKCRSDRSARKNRRMFVSVSNFFLTSNQGQRSVETIENGAKSFLIEEKQNSKLFEDLIKSVCWRWFTVTRRRWFD